MEFLERNYILTTTAITVDSNTGTVSNILSRDETLQYTSDGYDDDLTIASVTFDFGSTQTVSRISANGINAKGFDIFYDGVTANTFALTVTADTSTSQWNSNSETALYLKFNTVSCQTITIDMKTTQVANAEKAIGWFVASDVKLSFTRLPKAADYSPLVRKKQVVHELSDGRRRIHSVGRVWSANIGLEYVSDAFRNSLYSVWRDSENFIFVPFGTSSGWDGFIMPVVWPGDFDFHKYSDDFAGAGHSGRIRLMETIP